MHTIIDHPDRRSYVTATAGRFADCQAACRAIGSNWNAINGGRAADQNACAWYGTFGERSAAVIPRSCMCARSLVVLLVVGMH